MRPALLLGLLLAAPTTARSDDWTARDTALEASLMAVTALDVMETRYSLSRPGWTEANPLLGTHPTAARLYLGAASALILHFAIARALPAPYRALWQSVFIGVEGAAAAHNAWLLGGVRMAL